MISYSSSMKHKLFKMEYLVSCVTLALLFLAQIIPSEAEGTVKPNYDHDAKYKLYDIRGPLVLSCNVTLVPEKPYTLEWLKEDKPVSEDSGLKDRYKILPEENKLVIDRTLETDAGKYTCRVADASEVKADIEVVAKPMVKLPPDTSVVEGEKLKIVCTVVGNPSPVVEWIIGNETYKMDKGRVSLSDVNGVKNAIMTLSETTMDDRGEYSCRATNVANNYVNATKDSTFVRVKDKLAALWPFLGICAEVFVLCAIILVYEKRRNKPDMEESDTDQSPDQKK